MPLGDDENKSANQIRNELRSKFYIYFVYI